MAHMRVKAVSAMFAYGEGTSQSACGSLAASDEPGLLWGLHEEAFQLVQRAESLLQR